ncbi:RNA polymerase sigma-70 factor [Pedobacter sp. ASV1-7]|uniref:RNA polymerase sigma factor n=1 Tax=Pedobacter sp. ASV1-7 TaxID=3145237 RepID=UPI0032E87436
METYSKFTDAELVSLLQKGCHKAYTEIYHRYKGVLYKHALRVLNNTEEVNDIIHELFLNLWIKREKILITDKLSSYLYSSVRNRILDHIARNKFVTNYIASIQEYIQAAVPHTEQQVRLNELTRLIEREVSALPKKMKEIFEMSRNQELTHREIAEQLNISDHTVKKQINNALKILRPKITTLLAGIPFF